MFSIAEWNDSKLMGYTLVNSSDGSFFNVKVMYGADGEPSGYTITGDNDFEMGFVYTKNLQGDITGIYTLEGASCLLFSYDAYGIPTYTVGNSFIGAWLSLSLNPFLYRGYMYDINTGLYYLQSRHYNPIYGRFLNADETDVLHLPQGQIYGANLYSYCYNNPINMVDYSGMLPDWVIPVVLGFVRSLKGPAAWARYYSAKGLLSAGGNAFLGYKGYSVARMLYNHGMWGYGRALSQSNKNLIINTLKKSSYFNNQIKKALNAVKGTLVNKLKVPMNFTTGDLFYGIGTIDFYLTGSKKNNKWSVTVTGSDRYDFDSIWSFSKLSFGNAANDLGWAMQKIGMMIPFTWSVSFMYTY